MIVPDNDNKNIYVDIDKIQSIKNQKLRKSFVTSIFNIYGLSFFVTLIFSVLGIGFEHPVRIVAFVIAMICAAGQIFYFIKTHFLQEYHQFMKSMIIVYIFTGLFLLYEIGIAVWAYFNVVFVYDSESFGIMGYTFLYMPLASIAIFLILLAFATSTHLKCLSNLSRMREDDTVQEKLFFENFINKEKLFELEYIKRSRTMMISYFEAVAWLPIACLMFIANPGTDKQIINWFLMGSVFASFIVFIILSIISKAFKKWYYPVLLILPFILIALMRTGELVWGRPEFQFFNQLAELNTVLFIFVFIPIYVVNLMVCHYAFAKVLQNTVFVGNKRQEQKYIIRQEIEQEKKNQNNEDNE